MVELHAPAVRSHSFRVRPANPANERRIDIGYP